MTIASLEHVNVTVPDPARTAQMLVDLFGWKIRWQGAAMDGGHTVHVGTEEDYIAFYTPAQELHAAPVSYATTGGLNHVAIEVDDLDVIEQRVTAAGYKPHNHGDYEPGKRFYFHDHDGIEFEIVSYK